MPNPMSFVCCFPACDSDVDPFSAGSVRPAWPGPWAARAHCRDPTSCGRVTPFCELTNRPGIPLHGVPNPHKTTPDLPPSCRSRRSPPSPRRRSQRPRLAVRRGSVCAVCRSACLCLLMVSRLASLLPSVETGGGVALWPRSLLLPPLVRSARWVAPFAAGGSLYSPRCAPAAGAVRWSCPCDGTPSQSTRSCRRRR